jgi:hypothetical protein
VQDTPRSNSEATGADHERIDGFGFAAGRAGDGIALAGRRRHHGRAGRGAWIGNLTLLEPYQPIFAAVSLAFIGAGAWRLRKKRQIACADGYCATPRSDRIARTGLVAAAALVVIAVGFPYAARYFL